jgi:hypothetical protein
MAHDDDEEHEKTPFPFRDIRLICAVLFHAFSGFGLFVLVIRSCNFLLVQHFRFLYIA